MVLTLYIDTIAIICCMSLIVLFFVSMFCNPFLRARRLKKWALQAAEKEVDTTDTAAAPVSIVIPILEDAPELAATVEMMLQQEYAAPFRVILVADKGNALVERLSAENKDNKHMYCTFVPNSSRYMSRKKLTLTLGIKAADTDWVVILEPTCTPLSTKWLAALAPSLATDNRLVVGYTALEEDTRTSWRYQQLRSSFYILTRTLRGKAYRHAGGFVAMRKTDFMKRDGFSGNLNLLHGEYDYLVNKFGDDMATTVALHPETHTLTKAPTKKEWINKQLYFWETRKYLQGGWFSRFLFNIDNIMLYLNYIVAILCLVYGVIEERWLIVSVASANILLTVLLRILFAHKAIKVFNVELPAWRVIGFELMVPWRKIRSYFKYLKTDKYEFTSHKL
ncbi:glycosyltransferase [Hoylesella shahii]|jgi:glycosyl transferase, group 2 family protein domain-containing protein|uniref:glycosyltransferase n=1 Tax=Hoylesella shahii TaxID=228603 RepID=UPI002352869B|nr:glycosyltransferase [Hoylesella shahii]